MEHKDNPMKLILSLAAAGVLAGACTFPFTPDCDRYPYPNTCADGTGSAGVSLGGAPGGDPDPDPGPGPDPSPDPDPGPDNGDPGLGNPGNDRDVGRAGEDPPGRGGMNSPAQGGPGTRGASDGHAAESRG